MLLALGALMIHCPRQLKSKIPAWPRSGRLNRLRLRVHRRKQHLQFFFLCLQAVFSQETSAFWVHPFSHLASNDWCLCLKKKLKKLQSWGQAAHEGHLAGVMSWAALWCCFGQHLWCSTTVRARYSPGKEECSRSAAGVKAGDHCSDHFPPCQLGVWTKVKPLWDLIYERKGVRTDSRKMRLLHNFLYTIFPFCRALQAGCEVPQSFMERRRKWGNSGISMELVPIFH